MSQIVRFRLDDDACARLTALRERARAVVGPAGAAGAPAGAPAGRAAAPGARARGRGSRAAADAAPGVTVAAALGEGAAVTAGRPTVTAAPDATVAAAPGRGAAVTADRPSVTVAAATAVPAPARAALAAELRLLTLPSLWLATLGTAAGRPDELVLAAIVDTELLAVHTAVHDALAGRVRGPVADYLPGSWLPHCVLATASPAQAFALLHPLPPIRARVTGVEIHDTVTGTTEPV